MQRGLKSRAATPFSSPQRNIPRSINLIGYSIQKRLTDQHFQRYVTFMTLVHEQSMYQ